MSQMKSLAVWMNGERVSTWTALQGKDQLQNYYAPTPLQRGRRIVWLKGYCQGSAVVVVVERFFNWRKLVIGAYPVLSGILACDF